MLAHLKCPCAHRCFPLTNSVPTLSLSLFENLSLWTLSAGFGVCGGVLPRANPGLEPAKPAAQPDRTGETRGFGTRSEHLAPAAQPTGRDKAQGCVEGLVGPLGRHRQIWGRTLSPATREPSLRALLFFNHVSTHLTHRRLSLDVSSLFVCHPQNESPEPSTLILKSG